MLASSVALLVDKHGSTMLVSLFWYGVSALPFYAVFWRAAYYYGWAIVVTFVIRTHDYPKNQVSPYVYKSYLVLIAMIRSPALVCRRASRSFFCFGFQSLGFVMVETHWSSHFDDSEHSKSATFSLFYNRFKIDNTKNG